jgi:hypothetical protein
MITKKIDWGLELRKAHGTATKIRLPDKAKITFDGTPNNVRIHVTASGVVANMQTDGAAFEAWALALMAWCNVEEVVLSWDKPGGSEGMQHYERFIFRAHFFQQLLRDRVRMSNPLAARCLSAKDLTLNVAGDRALEPSPNLKKDSESWLEWQLFKSPTFKKHFQLRDIDRQFPVGLFIGEPAKGKGQVFTGGKSAIDLVAIDQDGTFWLFELKAKRKKASLGILSELLFYTAVIKESILDGSRFKFAKKEQGKGVTIGPDAARSCQRIEACLLADRFHPLLDRSDEKILKLLNEACSSFSPNIHFRTASPHRILGA